MTDTPAYNRLWHIFDRLGRLKSIEGLLLWDSYAVMPRGAAAARGAQLETLGAILTETVSEPNIAVDLSEAAEEELTDWDLENLRLMQHWHAHETAVPAKLAGAIAKAGSICESRWREAKAENKGAGNFSTVLSEWTELIQLSREAACAKAATLALAPHDALIDAWDPGITHSDIETLKYELEEPLKYKLATICRQQDETLAPPRISEHAQRPLIYQIANWLRYDSNHGAIMESDQPCFMDDSPDDVRITYRCKEADFRAGVIGITHEIGHFHYEHGIPRDWRYQPIGRPASAGIQESQSLLFEKHVMRSPGFIARLAEAIPDVTTKQLSLLLHQVSPGWCRIEADEVSYPLHVLIRHDLERDLIEGRLDPVDVPDAWRSAYVDKLGINVDNDAQGCLQDIHWYRGLFGYFQSYLIGTLAAAQLKASAIKADPGVDRDLKGGDIAPLLDWLKRNIFDHARRYPPQTLLKRATGAELSSAAFLAHVDKTYLSTHS